MGLKETKRLQKMVEDLLDFNRFAANTVTVTHQRVDLRAELKEIALRWQQAREKTNVRIEVETTSERRNWEVSTDPVRLEQIMVNLFNNARDAMQGGGTITVRLNAEPAQYRIEVQDTGEGIPAAEQAKVFEAFYRGERSGRMSLGSASAFPSANPFVGRRSGIGRQQSGRHDVRFNHSRHSIALTQNEHNTGL